jgi:hypothetical protein
MKYEVEAMKQKISLVVHSVAGIIIGYVSVGLNNALYSFGLAIAVLLVVGYAVEFIVKKKEIKWWLANGGALYILFWIVFWTYFYNYTLI